VVEDISLPEHPLDIYSVVFEAIDQRVERVWEDQ